MELLGAMLDPEIKSISSIKTENPEGNAAKLLLDAIHEYTEVTGADDEITIVPDSPAKKQKSSLITKYMTCPCPTDIVSDEVARLHTADLEKQLLETGLGFRFAKKGNFWDVKENKFFLVPGILLADDLCLMANKIGHMRALLEITSKFGDNRSIKFNPQKSGVIVFSRPPSTHTHDQGLTIHGRQIPEVEFYKYLGIELSAERDYLSQHWDEVTRTANKAIRRLNART
ncbi:uncharacterized protein LOC108865019 [Galendromus occidentalis]|uniref:Uncharacterized protein LOC108865019 n=1 Tax=Galendromus occidentalis TaxID=34638 RepID=A0AAJ7PAT9_9ACAR|nr:uncharacterized protein LOC108865019 [Galendromus occidentalis]